METLSELAAFLFLINIFILKYKYFLFQCILNASKLHLSSEVPEDGA